MAAYLDGMLSTEENYMVEAAISSSPELTELQEVVDSVDSAYVEELDCEIPIECAADDFVLPDVEDYDISDSEEAVGTDGEYDELMHDEQFDNVPEDSVDTDYFDDFEM